MHVHFVFLFSMCLIEEDKSEKKMIQHVFDLILGGNHTLSSTGINDKRNNNNNNSPQEKFNEQIVPMARLSRTTASEEYDSDFDDSSHEDDEPLTRTDSINEYDEEQQQNQIIVRQLEILWGIVQEWLRKEESYSEQLTKMDEQVLIKTFISFLLNLYF